MPRFVTNRWWTFILVLFLGLTVVTVGHVRPASAGSVTTTITYAGENGSGAGGGLPPGSGDPDVPIGSGRVPKPTGVSQGTGGIGMQAAGDSRMLDSAWMMRLQIALRMLRALYLH